MMFDKIAQLVWDLQGLDPEETMWDYDQAEFAEHLAAEADPIKLKLHTFVFDCGDGPYAVALFKTAEGARRRERFEIDYSGYALEEAVGSRDIVIDHDGNILTRLDYMFHDEEGAIVFED